MKKNLLMLNFILALIILQTGCGYRGKLVLPEKKTNLTSMFIGKNESRQN